LRGGDEVPTPVKDSLLKLKYVSKVDSYDEITGKRWAEQPIEIQKAWAELNGQTYLEEKSLDGRKRTVKVGVHPSQLVGADEATPSKPLKSQEVAGDDELPAPPVETRAVEKKKTKAAKKKARRGRPPKK
jgi:hypothetical protein